MISGKDALKNLAVNFFSNFYMEERAYIPMVTETYFSSTKDMVGNRFMSDLTE